jgi:glycine oxidase
VTGSPSQPLPDVLVIGAGLIGLACAAAAAERGFVVHLVGQSRRGEASVAAAGMLAPSIERAEGAGSAFAVAARDRYPAYLDWLRERSGMDVPLNRDGIIQIAINKGGVRGLRRAMPTDAQWLDARELHALEPALGHGLGGVFHEHDGAVDNVMLHDALLEVARRERRITIAEDIVSELSFTRSVTSVTMIGQSGIVYRADRVVLAAGAWSNTIHGLPRAIPVEPVRGQMIAYAAAPLRRVVYGPTGYVVPRANGRTLVGATMERAGYESVTTPEGVQRLRRTAAEILPQLADVAPSEVWSGLRPMSADLQPVLGPDPAEPRLVYATGHSRNGVLMTPITGECIAAVLCGESTPVSIDAFSVGRFSRSIS